MCRAVSHALRKKTGEKLVAKPQMVPEGDNGLTMGTSDTEPLTDEEESVVGEDPIADDNGLHMKGLQVTYPATKEKPSPIVMSKDDSPSQCTVAKTHALLSAIEMSNSCPSARQPALRTFPLQFMLDFAAAVIGDDIGELLEYRHLIQCPKRKTEWGHSFGNEVGRIAQGMPGRNEGTDTLSFIDKDEIPMERWKDIAHSRIVCNVRPQKEDVDRTRLTF